MHHRLRARRLEHAVRQIAINVASAGPTALSPFFIPMAIANMASGQIAINFGAAGPQLRDRVAPAPPAATRSARRPRRSAAATPT